MSSPWAGNNVRKSIPNLLICTFFFSFIKQQRKLKLVFPYFISIVSLDVWKHEIIIFVLTINNCLTWISVNFYILFYYFLLCCPIYSSRPDLIKPKPQSSLYTFMSFNCTKLIVLSSNMIFLVSINQSICYFPCTCSLFYCIRQVSPFHIHSRSNLASAQCCPYTVMKLNVVVTYYYFNNNLWTSKLTLYFKT